MKESNRLAGNVTVNQLKSSMFLNTERYHIKKQTKILAGIEDIGQLQRKGQYIKESYMLAGSAFIKQLQKEIMLYTKGQYVSV